MEAIFSEAKKQGFAVLILCIASFIFWNKLEKVESRWDACQNEKIGILKDVVLQNSILIQRATTAIENQPKQVEQSRSKK